MNLFRFRRTWFVLKYRLPVLRTFENAASFYQWCNAKIFTGIAIHGGRAFDVGDYIEVY